MGHLSHRGNVQHFDAGVAQRLGEDQTGLGSDGLGEGRRVSRVNE